MKTLRLLATTSLLSLAVALMACGGDDTSSAKPSCDEIAAACHDFTSGPGHDCHEQAEAAATTEAMCASNKAACLAVCSANLADAGPTPDAALPDAQ
jgi:hypothetical protein